MKINKDKKFLAQPCVDVPEKDFPMVAGILKRELFQLNNPKHTAYGLACNQIGLRYRAFAMMIQGVPDLPSNADIIEEGTFATGMLCFINPKVLDMWGTASNLKEKCLSLKKQFKVSRRYNIIVTDDLVLKGKPLTLYGLNSKIFQHEMDHLNGITIETRSKTDDSNR